MKLNFKTFGKGSPLVILHGLFGSLNNWITPSKKLAEHHKIYLIDLPNHGNSPHSHTFTYQNMVSELLVFCQEHEINTANLLGHSMGGKVAMQFACLYPNIIQKMIVIDIAPKKYAFQHQQILDGFNAVLLDKLHSRGEAERQMSEIIKETGVRQFLLKNLSRNKNGKFSWKHNLKIIEANIDKIGVPLAKDGIYHHPTLFIKGGKSNYILDSDEELIKKHFPSAKITNIPNAGHWVHAEQPKVLIEEVLKFII